MPAGFEAFWRLVRTCRKHISISIKDVCQFKSSSAIHNFFSLIVAAAGVRKRYRVLRVLEGFPEEVVGIKAGTTRNYAVFPWKCRSNSLESLGTSSEQLHLIWSALTHQNDVLPSRLRIETIDLSQKDHQDMTNSHYSAMAIRGTQDLQRCLMSSFCPSAHLTTEKSPSISPCMIGLRMSRFLSMETDLSAQGLSYSKNSCKSYKEQRKDDESVVQRSTKTTECRAQVVVA